MGLAVGDAATGVVSPLEILPYRSAAQAAALIAERARRLGVGCIVVGLPTGADGERTPACRRSEVIAAELEKQGLRVALQNEYLTTNEARRRAREAGVPPRRPVDHLAAQVLLEQYLQEQ